MINFSEFKKVFQEKREKFNRAANGSPLTTFFILIPVILASSAKFPLYPIFPFYPLFNVIVLIIYTILVFRMLRLLDANKKKKKDRAALMAKENKIELSS